MNESQQEDRVKPIQFPPVIFSVPLLLALVLNWFFPLPIFSSDSLFLRLLLGNTLLFLGIVLVSWAARSMNSKGVDPVFKPVGTIVTHGPFKYTRNPMYVSFTLLYLGLSVLFNTFWPLPFLILVFSVLYYGVVKREEAYMEKKFGKEYLAYKNRVRRWI